MSLILYKFHSVISTLDFFNIPILGPTLNMMLEYPVIMDWTALLVYGVMFILSLFLLSKVEVGSATYVISFFILFAVSFGFYVIGVTLDAVVQSNILGEITSSMIFIPFYAGNVLLFSILYAFMCLIAMHVPSQ